MPSSTIALDTNALSAIADGDPSALKQFNTHEVALPVIVVGEYRFGISRSRHRVQYEEWLTELIRTSSVLEISEQTANAYALIRAQVEKAGTPIPSNDTWIAALCHQHSLRLMSRDSHFDRVLGLSRISW